MTRIIACLGLALLAVPLLATVPQPQARNDQGIAAAKHAVVLARAEARQTEA